MSHDTTTPIHGVSLPPSGEQYTAPIPRPSSSAEGSQPSDTAAPEPVIDSDVEAHGVLDAVPPDRTEFTSEVIEAIADRLHERFISDGSGGGGDNGGLFGGMTPRARKSLLAVVIAAVLTGPFAGSYVAGQMALDDQRVHAIVSDELDAHVEKGPHAESLQILSTQADRIRDVETAVTIMSERVNALGDTMKDIKGELTDIRRSRRR